MNCAFTISKYLFNYFLIPLTILGFLAFLGFNFLHAKNLLFSSISLISILLLILIPGISLAKLLNVSPAETTALLLIINLFQLYIMLIFHIHPLPLILSLTITYIPTLKVLGNGILQCNNYLTDSALFGKLFHKIPIPHNHYQKDRNTPNYTLAEIDKMDGEKFEHYVANLLSLYKFTNIRVSPYSQDQGLDVYAEYQSIKYGFQCKRWERNIPLSAIQEIYTAKELYQIDRAIVITNSGFTRAAISAALKLDVILIDRNRLDEMIQGIQNPEQNPIF